MTETGAWLGTPVYMSPEQVKADPSIDFRSDIYSLGVTLFLAVTGKAPYSTDKESRLDIFNKIVQQSLPAIPHQQKYNRLIQKACQKNREHRFQTCMEWLEDWKNYSDTSSKKTDKSATHSSKISQSNFSNSTAKFIQKHKIKIGLISTFLIVLVGSISLILDKRENKKSDSGVKECVGTITEAEILKGQAMKGDICCECTDGQIITTNDQKVTIEDTEVVKIEDKKEPEPREPKQPETPPEPKKPEPKNPNEKVPEHGYKKDGKWIAGKDDNGVSAMAAHMSLSENRTITPLAVRRANNLIDPNSNIIAGKAYIIPK